MAEATKDSNEPKNHVDTRTTKNTRTAYIPSTDRLLVKAPFYCASVGEFCPRISRKRGTELRVKKSRLTNSSIRFAGFSGGSEHENDCQAIFFCA